MSVAKQIPLVEYLELEPSFRLVVNECSSCGARYFDRRNACAACEGDAFVKVPLETTGVVKSFTIVSFAAPGIPVPFAAAVIDLGGTSVRANLVNVEVDPEHISLGMRVRLTPVSLGEDAEGTEAIGFGFEPCD